MQLHIIHIGVAINKGVKNQESLSLRTNNTGAFLLLSTVKSCIFAV